MFKYNAVYFHTPVRLAAVMRYKMKLVEPQRKKKIVTWLECFVREAEHWRSALELSSHTLQSDSGNALHFQQLLHTVMQDMSCTVSLRMHGFKKKNIINNAIWLWKHCASSTVGDAYQTVTGPQSCFVYFTDQHLFKS